MSDAVSRDAVIQALQEWTYCCDAEEMIRALPAVQPDAGSKPFDCECGQVGPCKAPFCTPRSAQSHVNETPKSEHEAGNMLTPATKGGA